MKSTDWSILSLGTMTLAWAFAPGLALAFNSGSTGADGAFTPTVNTEVTLPASGIFNYTSVTIPAGVTVTYKKNTANTPVVILATSDVTIAGTIDVRGKAAPGVGAAGNGNQGDDGQPGAGGPGGFDGGKGGAAGAGFTFGGAGVGPGSGNPGFFGLPGPNCVDGSGWASGGTGGGFSAQAAVGSPGDINCSGGGQFTYTFTRAQGGVAYGSSLLLPLIGGSGGGGGGGGVTFDGGGGGGGGGAILLASSGTVTVAGSLLTDGGAGAAASGGGIGGAGGGASGGAIRIMATTIAGNGPISATGGAAGTHSGQTYSVFSATAGSVGRIRLEGDTITRTAATTPLATSDTPGPVFVAGFPTLTIASVAGQTAPANPTGNADITLPAGTANPVTVTFATTGVPVGNIVRLTVTPQNGQATSVVSPAITGSTANGTASIPVTLPIGPSVLQAQTTFTVTAALGELLRYYAGNERVEQIELAATLGGPSVVRLITKSGKSYEVPAALLAELGM